jgi:hypothetical protein
VRPSAKYAHATATGWALGVDTYCGSMHVLYRQMGAVKRVVVKVQEIVSTAKTFKWKEFKAYRGGVLLVRSTRLHKVARTHDAHGHARGPCCDREENWGKERERSPTGLKAPEERLLGSVVCGVAQAATAAHRPSEFDPCQYAVCSSVCSPGHRTRHLRAQVPCELCDCDHCGG